MKLYDFHFFGLSDKRLVKLFEKKLFSAVVRSGVSHDDISLFVSEADRGKWRDMRRPIAAIVFGSVTGHDTLILEDFVKRRVPIIPVLVDETKITTLPNSLQEINSLPYLGTDAQADRIIQSAMDLLGLLREQRRIFLSYRREVASGVAVQLHDHLSSVGFNVFLDTHSIRPGEFFQGSLWQSLCDSDVLVMLETPDYFNSRWTTEEFGKARSSEVSILRLVWPGHTPAEEAALSETIDLSNASFDGDRLVQMVLDKVVERAEKLRARSIAARHLQITGKLQDEAQSVGASILGAGAFRAVSVRLASGNNVWVYPVIGVPTAEIMNDIAKKAIDADHECPFLVYDAQGLTDQWLEHLEWLNGYIPEVDFMKVSEAGRELAQRS